ncbi:Hypothetical predicted protein [Mytilus galloprovincialis]|uniref:MCM8 N-terminal domain-containing protein n=1 Tax=Mytilus galloprovincialis TaxID=29158 RepID=A0A8B6CRX6_MYTGA|nr:Hypothetical predicted protein [Mytilus galloprovincialis]
MSQTSTSSAGSWQGGRGWRGRGWWRGRGGGRYYSHHGNRGRGNSQSHGRGGRMMDDPQPNRRPASQMVQTVIEVQSPYKGWKYYFPEEAYNDHSPTVKKVQVFEKYFLSWSQSYKWDDVEEKGYFIVDMKELLADQILMEGIPDLSTEMKDMPDRILSCIGLAVHQVNFFLENKELRF